MKIVSGLMDNQLFQRELKSNKATINCHGVCNSFGTVLSRIKGWKKWSETGMASNGKWQAEIKFCETGGPYDIEFKIEREISIVKNILIGDIWVLAGQSNMVGDGRWKDPEMESEFIRVLDMGGNWKNAASPLHETWLSPDIVHNSSGKVSEPPENKTIGLGMSFARRLYKETGMPVGLVPAAKGATTMNQWSPSLKHHGGESLYGSMLNRINKYSQNKIRGILWYQGESDATEELAPLYEVKLKEFVKELRKDLDNQELPFVFAQIGRVLTFDNDPNLEKHTIDSWNNIQLIQLEFEKKERNTFMVATVDLELDNKIHLSREGLRLLAYRFADVVLGGFYNRKEIFPGPEIKEVTAVRKESDPWLEVTVAGQNINLKTSGRPSGFSVYKNDGSINPVIKTVIVSADRIRIYLHEFMEGGILWYGRGIDPYCNFTDSRGLALPVSRFQIPAKI